jgi:hypothetical protein
MQKKKTKQNEGFGKIAVLYFAVQPKKLLHKKYDRLTEKEKNNIPLPPPALKSQ